MTSGLRSEHGNEHEAVWQQALESIDYGVVVADRSGTVECANNAAREMLGDGAGVPAGRERGEKCGIFGPDEVTPCPPESLPLARGLAGETVHEAEIFVRNDQHPEGKRLSTSVRPVLNRDGRVTGAVAVYRDITSEHREREKHRLQVEDLRSRMYRLEALFDNALDAVLLADNGMRFIDVNPSACTLLGYTRDQLLQASIPQITAPEYHDGVRNQWAAFLRAGIAEGELALARQDGSRVDVEFRSVANILPSVHLSIIRDITDRKRAETAVRETQRTESLGVLAGGAAHDFNNLLVGVIGNASLALEQLAETDRVVPLIRDILAAGTRASQLTRQMLRYAGKDVPNRESVDLTDSVREIGALIRSSIPKQVEVDYQLSDVPPVLADPGQLQQVIMNLIINAGQAIYEQTPGRISVRTELRVLKGPDREPEAADLPTGEYVALEVEDSGRGMDQRVRERIFSPFFSTKVEGKGLGLATVRTIVRDHGGAIWVRTAPGRGSCFSVLLPVTAAEASQEALQELEAIPKRSLRILVVDNERLVQRMAKAALEPMGHRVTVLTDGRDALPLLASSQGDFDAVLLDLGLAGVSAPRLAAEILEVRPTVKLISSTGYPEADARRWLEGISAAGFIQKPYTAAQLKRAIEKAVR